MHINVITGGPYHIATAEEQPALRKGGARGRLYWRVKVEDTLAENVTYQITCTNDLKKASNFYLKPFEEKYFLIATDPEDPRTANQLKMEDLPNPATAPEVSYTNNQLEIENQRTATDTGDQQTPNQPKIDDPSKPTTISPATSTSTGPEDPHTPSRPVYTRAPQRFVRKQDSHLSAEIVIDKKMAAFKLKNPKLCHSLSKSQWLPEAALGSQPYFIHLRGSSSRQKSILTVGSRGETDTDAEHVISCYSNDERILILRQLFILEPGHPT